MQFIDIQLGGAEFQAQRYEPAIKLLQEAIKSTKGMQGDAPKLALPYSLLGMCYYRTNKDAEAKAAFESALKAVEGKGHVFDECVCNLYLALICEKQKNATAAMIHYEKAIGLMSRKEIIPNTYSIIEKSTLLDITKARLNAVQNGGQN